MRRLLCMILVACLALGAAPALAEKRLEINLCHTSMPETMDPTLNAASDGSIYLIHLFEPLMRYKWDGTGVEPGMAERYETTGDGLVWTFHLRESKWSDGKPVRAQDFEYALRRLVDPQTAAPNALEFGSYLKNGRAITNGERPVADLGVRSIDEKTLEITLESVCPYFTEILAYPSLGPLRQDIIERYGANEWVKHPDSYVSNGAFKMKSLDVDSELEVIPNEGYWDRANVVPTEIDWLWLQDDKAQMAAFQAEDLDFADLVPQEEVKRLQAEGTYGFQPILGAVFVSFNTEFKPLDNPLVRKALTLAIDNDYIANTLREGLVIPATAFVGPGFRTVGADEDFRDCGQDLIPSGQHEKNLEAARAALKEAGYPDGQGLPRFEYMVNDSSVYIAMAEALQRMWQDIGVNVELRVVDWATINSARNNGDYQIARHGWLADYRDPVAMLAMFQSGGGSNSGRYKSAAYDEKLAAAAVELNPQKRDQLLHDAEAILIGEDYAVAPVFYGSDDWLCRSNFKDWAIYPNGYKFFFRAYVEEVPEEDDDWDW